MTLLVPEISHWMWHKINKCSNGLLKLFIHFKRNALVWQTHVYEFTKLKQVLFFCIL